MPPPAGRLARALGSLAALSLAALALAGCTGLLGGGEQPHVDGLFDFSDASYDSGAGGYDVHVGGQVVVPASGDARDARLRLAAAPGCGARPADEAWATLVLGHLAAGGATNLRDSAVLPSPILQEPSLQYQLTLGASTGPARIADRGCGALRLSP